MDFDLFEWFESLPNEASESHTHSHIIYLQEHPRPKYETLLLQKTQKKRRNKKKSKREVSSFLIRC